MELCTAQSISTLPKISPTTHLTTKSSPTLHKTLLYLPSACRLRLRSRLLYCSGLVPKATMSEESSSGLNQCVVEERDVAVAVEDSRLVGKNVYGESIGSEVVKDEESPLNDKVNEFLTSLNVKFDPEDASSILLYGSGALVLVWLASAVVASIDSIPLFPKMMEVVGLGYTFWFTTRYLLFKQNRDVLAAKVDELKQQVFGSDDE